jgi:uncharacterized protein (TIGR03435 family)
MRKLQALVLLAGIASSASAQSAQPLKFELAAIHRLGRPQRPKSIDPANSVCNSCLRVEGLRVILGSVSLKLLVMMAFDVAGERLTGPDWIADRDEKFEIHATMPPGSSAEDVPQMLQSLLADRFKLVLHRTYKEEPVYALVVGKGELKIQKSAADAGFADDGKKVRTLSDAGFSSITTNVPGGPTKLSVADGITHVEHARVTMKFLAGTLSFKADRPVVDRTGLSGTYHVVMDLPSNVPAASKGQASEPPKINLLDAVQKIGLKLEPRTEPVLYITIDHIEKNPTEN